MPVTTISRTHYTTWQNDSGSGTDGTVIDKQFFDDILDDIDAIFAGNITFGGSIGSETTATHRFVGTNNATMRFEMGNTNAGTGSNYAILLFNDNAIGIATEIRQTGTNYTASGTIPQDGFSIDSQRAGGISLAATNASGAIRFYANGATQRLVINAGIQVGSPTGGDKGAGTANFAADIYKNNTAYTNPAFVFEKAYTGQIERFIDRARASNLLDYAGPMPLDEVERFTREHYDLPLMAREYDAGLFARGDLLLATVEEAYLHLFDLHRRLGALERRAA